MEKRKYLVYKITNLKNNKIYIGVHTTTNINDDYMGSGTNIRQAIQEHGLENFEKEILHVFDNQEEMLEKERELVNEEFIKRSDTYNLVLGGGGFLMVDNVVVKDKQGNISMVSVDDPRYKSDELVHHSTGTISVKDKNGNCFRVHKNNPRYLSGELVGPTKDMVPVKDKDGNTSMVSKDDPRYKSGELIHVSSNMIVVKDKDGNTIWVSKNDPRYLSGELVWHHKDTVVVKDKDGNHYRVDKNDPRYVNGELVHIWTNRKHTQESKAKIGKANSKHQSGKNNINYGTMWIHNQELKENKRINKDEPIPSGWEKGRKMEYSKNYTPKMWIYNQELEKNKKIDKNKDIPQGWKRGLKVEYH